MTDRDVWAAAVAIVKRCGDDTTSPEAALRTTGPDEICERYRNAY
jgi:hypothetical protein